MSYVPPPPSGPPPGNRPRGSRTPLLVGALIGALAPILGSVPLFVVDAPTLGTGMLAWLLVLVTGVGLLFPASTRRWGAGLLIGLSVMLVVGAGACIALIVTFDGGMN